jgi:hypothetical protein
VSLLEKIAGFTAAISIGGPSGPTLTASGTRLTASGNVAGLDPAAATDFVTLEYGNANYVGTPSTPSVAASAAINTTATYITPSTPIPANTLQVGTTYQITVSGTCTSTAANVSTFVLRLGTAGTTADTSVCSVTCTAAASGTTIPFTAFFRVTIRTTGSAGTAMGSGCIINTGITGISSNGVGGGGSTATSAVNTTVANFVGVSYSSAATTTTCTFQIAFVEVVKA